MKKQFIYLFLSLAVMISACKKDNYKAPDTTISGNVVDAATGANVPQQTLNGAKIRLYQTDYSNPQPINSSIHADGSYENDFIFSGNYKVVAEGPFFYTDTVKLNIKGSAKQDLKVTPYLTVTCQLLSKTASSITVKVKIKRSAQNTQKIARVAVIAGTTNSTDINNYYNLNTTNNGRVLENTEAVADADAITKDYTFTLSSLTPGTLYYVRGCARTINTGNFYNYAPMLEITTDAQ